MVSFTNLTSYLLSSNDVISGLFLLQETFKLNVSKFSGGVAELPGHGSFSAERGLQAGDSHYISKIAFNR